MKEKDYKFLDLFANSSDNKSLELIKKCDEKQVILILECITNILLNVVPISKYNKKKMYENRKVIRVLAKQVLRPNSRKGLIIKNLKLIKKLVKICLKYLQGNG